MTDTLKLTVDQITEANDAIDAASAHGITIQMMLRREGFLLNAAAAGGGAVFNDIHVIPYQTLTEASTPAQQAKILLNEIEAQVERLKSQLQPPEQA